jgi:ABC-type multidrug transport system ATPase subunit
MDMPLILMEHVSVHNERGEDLFSDLSLKLEPNRSAVIIGAAGTGKTRLVELLIGLRHANSGRVEVFGETLKRRRYGIKRRIRRKIGGVGGPFALIPSLTVSENVSLPLILQGEKERVLKERLAHFLAEFGLLAQANQRPLTLSRVEHTLVQLARASIAHQPLMIIDEPAAGLDPRTSAMVFDYMVKASLAGRSMLILTSQLLPVDIPNCDQYAFVKGTLECFG